MLSLFLSFRHSLYNIYSHFTFFFLLVSSFLLCFSIQIHIGKHTHNTHPHTYGIYHISPFLVSSRFVIIFSQILLQIKMNNFEKHAYKHVFTATFHLWKHVLIVNQKDSDSPGLHINKRKRKNENFEKIS